MTGYSLSPGISACRVGGRLVFLDLPKDRYFALPAATDAALARLLDRSARVAGDESHIKRLIEKGVLRPDSRCEAPELCDAPPAARASMLDEIFPQREFGHAVGAVSRITLERLRLRVRGLAATIGQLQRAPHRDIAADDAALRDIVSAYASAGAYASQRDRCLPSSLALARQLFHRGLGGSLIIGVDLRPFRAHCWVQSGECVLNDRVDSVRVFTPILVV
ncbi:lasso peptide biosynthesis B2 protein [Sphingomonas oligophenolica]|uniref:Lasso peptide biosynthesis B2 protein n=1 Tax=Sphingomonas oligophenolica TaxID=301154 RepID=A0ABU9Y3F2_9SPHN